MKKVIVDSAVFEDTQLDFILRTAEVISRISDCEVIVLDRGKVPASTALTCLSFPSYSLHRFTADDSILLQKICDQMRADLFVSVLTTPLTTPMLLLVPDKESRYPSESRPMMEHDLATTYAIAVFCQDAATVRRIITYNDNIAAKLIYNLSIIFGGRSDSHSLATLAARRSHSFYKDWAILRRIQANVDTVIWDP